MKYIRIHDKRTGIDYPWMADVRSFEDFMKIEEMQCSKNASCIVDFLQSKDYASVVNKTFSGANIEWGGRDHCSPWNKLYPFLYASVLSFPEGKKFSPLIYFVEKLGGASQGKLKSLNEHGRILVNENGGFMTWAPTFEELESVTNNRFPQFSLDDIKVSKWPGCKHFYPTINGSAIVVNGIEKWNTEQDAINAAKKWLGVK
jgi:hypothetical protein